MIIDIHPGDSINKVINTASSKDEIIIHEGIYSEKVRITKSNLHIKGLGNVVIQNKDWYSKIHIDNKEYNTFRTYTVMVLGDDITIENVTIKNLSVPSSLYGQAVALHVLGTNFRLIDSKLYSAQDTLFMAPLPVNLQSKYIGFLYPEELSSRYNKMYFKDCYIEGDVDFIFGGADAVFDNCHFHAIEGHTAQYFFAPCHTEEMEYGFTIINSKFTSDVKGVTLLARPWRDYGKVTIINANIEDGIIKEEGFNKWNNTNRDKTARFAYYNIGMDTSKFVKWSKELTKAEADKYIEHAKSFQ